MKTVIGIDPDTSKHGVAIYRNCKLVELHSMELMDIVYKIIIPHKTTIINPHLVFSIEDVEAVKGIYTRNIASNAVATTKVAQNVGACKHAYRELIKALDYHSINYVTHKPTRHNWAKNKERFEQITGWNKKSNADTRSAAYFGYLAA